MTADGKGYWFVAADGGVFTFGNAKFHGSTGNMHWRRRCMSMTSATRTARATGWSRPTAASSPSTCRSRAACPACARSRTRRSCRRVRMRALPSGKGYYLLGVERHGVRVRHRQVLRFRARASGPSTSCSRPSQRVTSRDGARGRRRLARGSRASRAGPRPTARRCRYSITASGSWPSRTSATPITVPVRPRPPMQCTATPIAALEVRDDVGGGAASTSARSRSGPAGGPPLTRSCSRNAVTRARRRVVGRDIVGEAHDVADAFRREQRPVGAARDTTCPRARRACGSPSRGRRARRAAPRKPVCAPTGQQAERHRCRSPRS